MDIRNEANKDSLLSALESIRAKYISPADFWVRYKEADGNLRVVTVNIEILKELLIDPTFLNKADFCTVDSGLLEGVMNKLFREHFERLTGREIVARSPDYINERKVLLFGASNLARERAVKRYKASGAATEDVGAYSEPSDLEQDQTPRSNQRQAAFFAYGYPKQELKIDSFFNQFPEVPVLAIGVGGAVDYFAKIVPNPPAFLHQLGLEWVWRLGLQPHIRLRRILGIVPFAIRLKRLAAHKKTDNSPS